MVARLKSRPAADHSPTQPTLYAEVGHRHILEHCLRLATEELAAIDQLHAPEGSVEARDLVQMRGQVAAMRREFQQDLERVVEPAIREQDKEWYRRMIQQREASIAHNVSNLRPHIHIRDRQRDYRDAARYRTQLIRIPLEVERGTRI